MDDEVDVEGEDETMFGAVQFTEEDILALNPDSHDLENIDADIDIEVENHAEDNQELKPLRDLVAEGKIMKRQTTTVMEVKRNMEEVMGVAEVDQVEQAVKAARLKGDGAALIAALESKVKFLVSLLDDVICWLPNFMGQESSRVSSSKSSLCRICLDPYTEPTVSTGCWHTCCRECWLRCLGSTKLCPICKRITGATDLRRVYL